MATTHGAGQEVGSNTWGHSLPGTEQGPLYPKPRNMPGSLTSTWMLLSAESETYVLKTYFKLLYLISFLSHSSLTSLKSF